MSRRTLDIIISTGGLGIVALLLIGAFVLRGEANFSRNYVKDQLAQQKITFTTADKITDLDRQYTADRTNCVVTYAGQPLDSGKKAECFANEYLGSHLSRMPTADNPMTYSEIGDAQAAVRADIAAARAAGLPTADLDARLATLTNQRETVFKGEMLRGALLTSYGFSVLGEKAALGANIAFTGAIIFAVLSVAGFIHAFVTPATKPFAPVATPQTGRPVGARVEA